MATGSEGRGTVKKGGKFRTPKLSSAEKRARSLSRQLTPRNARTTAGGNVPF